MTENSNIPDERISVTFNPYKHHLGFLREKIDRWKKTDWKTAEQEIRLIGSNLTDLYIGNLSTGEIIRETLIFAANNEITSPSKLAQWLYPLEYRKFLLSDNSVWVIKQGQDNTRFLHIHPGKYSPLTIRVKAPALKTVIALKIHDDSDMSPNLALVNKLRIEKLNLSPVKRLIAGKGIARLLANFNSM